MGNTEELEGHVSVFGIVLPIGIVFAVFLTILYIIRRRQIRQRQGSHNRVVRYQHGGSVQRSDSDRRINIYSVTNRQQGGVNNPSYDTAPICEDLAGIASPSTTGPRNGSERDFDNPSNGSCGSLATSSTSNAPGEEHINEELDCAVKPDPNQSDDQNIYEEI